MQIDSIDSIPKPNCNINTTNYKGKYSVNDLEQVRKHLLKEVYEESIFFEELTAKKKCGILSKDVIDYYKDNIKKSNLRYISQEDYKDTDDHENEHSNQNINDDKSPLNNLKGIEKVVESKELEPRPVDIDLESIVNQTKLLCRSLNLAHGCEVDELVFCPRQIIAADSSYKISNLTSIYICDICQVSISYRENMLKHLNEAKHLSASEYYIEKIVTENSSLSNKVKYIKARSSLLNTNNLTEIAVFCPKCHFCFGKSIAACSLHYKYEHNSDQYVYSLSILKKTEKISVDKSHSCFECHARFKKLTDLVTHLESTRHFPKNPDTEISVLGCPFDKCGFKSIHFFSFKQHIMTHSYFQLKNDSFNEISVSAVLYIYNKPKSLYHISQFINAKEDNIDELKTIESLMETLKGHNDSLDVQKKLKCRRDQLHKH